MRSSFAFLASCGAAAAVFSTASAAFAHIDLINPVSRYVVNRPAGGGSKECPCGGPVDIIEADRKCDNPGQGNDPNRSTKVTPLEAGSKLSISVVEYINHSGRFRVAFDDDGADMTDFNSHILLDVPDDNTKQGSTNAPAYVFEVTLPMMTCDNCTLQVIQDMNNNTTTPVQDPSNDSTYYTCADIQLVAPGSMGGDDGMDDGMADPTPPPNQNTMGSMGTNAGAMGTGMGAGNGTMGSGLGSVPAMGDTTSGGTMMPSTGTTTTGVGSLMPAMNAPTSVPMGMPNLMAANSSDDSSGGCSLGARTPANPFAALAVAGMFSALAARRRARRQK